MVTDGHNGVLVMGWAGHVLLWAGYVLGWALGHPGV
jgi:hypothetical protein